MRTIEAKLAGHEDAKQVVEATAGGRVDVALTLKATAAPVPTATPGSASIAARSTPTAPAAAPETPGEAPSKNTTILVGGVAVAVVGLGIGVGFTAAWSGAVGDADALLGDLEARGGKSPCAGGSFANECATLVGHNEDSDTFGNVAIAGYVLGGIAAGATLAYALWPMQGGAQQGRARVVPFVGTDAGGVVVRGVF
jgi:hypothetical protein